MRKTGAGKYGATNTSLFSCELKPDKFKTTNAKSMGRTTGFMNVFCDRNGNVWATGNWSLYKYNPANDRFDVMVNTTNSLDSLNIYGIKKRFDRRSEKKRILDNNGIGPHVLWWPVINSQTLNQYQVTRFSQKEMLLHCAGRPGGITGFDNNKKCIIQFDPSTQQEIRFDQHTWSDAWCWWEPLFEDNNNRIWFSSWNHKMLVVDMSQEQ